MRQRRPNGELSYDWTPERIDLLTTLWPTHSASEIAKRLGGFEGYAENGRLAVSGKADRLGLPAKDRTQAMISSHARRASEKRWSGRPNLAEPWKPGDPKPGSAASD